jgi:hypothetical protein
VGILEGFARPFEFAAQLSDGIDANGDAVEPPAKHVMAEAHLFADAAAGLPRAEVQPRQRRIARREVRNEPGGGEALAAGQLA